MADILSVDARGLSCPEPVIMAKQAMKRLGTGQVDVLVDSGAPRDNVKRAAEMAGWAVSIDNLPGGEFRLTIAK